MTLAPLVLSLALLAEPATVSPKARRLALLVGANEAPPGRPTLRFAHRDAQRLRDALERVGGVNPADTALLLDPEPAAVLAALERLSAVARAEPMETVLYFYYSGHADESLLYPGGKALPITAVRDALIKGGATVRVGIFDACRGGSWTRAKGLSPAPPVELRPAWALASEGTVLFASSSGLEAAHESDLLQGSFFTHHLVGGLLGGADTSGDGAVTATEAFQYAQAHTVRDSARASLEPQHPSFELNLHGRNDLVMAQLELGSSTLAVEQAAGPLQVVELPQGLVLLELPEGKRSSRLAVAPGQYLIRRIEQGGVVTAREVRVAAGETTTIEESSLVLVGTSQLERKGEAQVPRTQETTLPARTMAVTLGLGYGFTSRPLTSLSLQPAPSVVLLVPQMAARLSFGWSPVDRLQVSVGMFGVGAAVLLGSRRRDEVVLSGGLDFGWNQAIQFYPSLGAAYRHWLSGATSLGLGASAAGRFSSAAARDYALAGGVMVTHTLREVVSLSFGVGPVGGVGSSSQWLGLSFGSAKLGSARTFPLIEVHLTPVWSLDLDAQLTLMLRPTVQLSQQYLAGFTAIW